MSGVKDFKTIEFISDWTYSTPYKGTLLPLNENIERIQQTLGLDLSGDVEPETSCIKVSRCEDEIPVQRLTPENPIIHYLEVPLFEDELDDSGQTTSMLRFRIMEDCFYACLRFYVRVDNVIVRVLDTRIFHDFTTNHMVREFWQKEATYDELR
jgi:type 2A phosphatase activator TIP41